MSQLTFFTQAITEIGRVQSLLICAQHAPGIVEVAGSGARIHPNPAANWPGIRNVVLLHNGYARRRLLVKLRFHGRCHFVQDQITHRLGESTGYLSQIHRLVRVPGTE